MNKRVNDLSALPQGLVDELLEQLGNPEFRLHEDTPSGVKYNLVVSNYCEVIEENVEVPDSAPVDAPTFNLRGDKVRGFVIKFEEPEPKHFVVHEIDSRIGYRQYK